MSRTQNYLKNRRESFNSMMTSLVPQTVLKRDTIQDSGNSGKKN